MVYKFEAKSVFNIKIIEKQNKQKWKDKTVNAMPSVMPRSALADPTATARAKAANARTAAVASAHATTPSVSDANAKETANVETNVSAELLDMNIFNHSSLFQSIYFLELSCYFASAYES